jgi:hypothetical protein
VSNWQIFFARIRELGEEVETQEKPGTNASNLEYLTSQDQAAFNDGQLGPVALMLIGFAIENISKGLLVIRSPSSAVKKGRFQYGTHNLVDLVVEKCQVALSDKEHDVLLVATDYTRWKGRYFAPMGVDDLLPRQRKEDGVGEEPGAFHWNYYEILVAIYDRVITQYEFENEQQRVKRIEEGIEQS